MKAALDLGELFAEIFQNAFDFSPFQLCNMKRVLLFLQVIGHFRWSYQYCLTFKLNVNVIDKPEAARDLNNYNCYFSCNEYGCDYLTYEVCSE